MNAPPGELVAALRSLMPVYGYDRVPLGLVLAQSALETGYWSSPVYVNGRNAFGLRRARVRPTIAVGVYAGHAAYRSLTDSARDYLDRQRAFGIPNTGDPGAYVSATVRSGYATASNYGPTWMGVYRDRFREGGAPDHGAVLALFVALGLYAATQ